jgi:hypothetical protein
MDIARKQMIATGLTSAPRTRRKYKAGPLSKNMRIKSIVEKKATTIDITVITMNVCFIFGSNRNDGAIS